MNVNLPPIAPVPAPALPQERASAPAAPPCAAPATAAPIPPSDADIVRAAEAALKSDSVLDSRVVEIKHAILAGSVSFDADALAASILRYHGRQD